MPLSIDGMNVGQYSYRPIGTAGNSLQTNALNRVQPTTPVSYTHLTLPTTSYV